MAIAGPYDPEIDGPGLQYFRLRDEALNRLGQQAADPDEKIEMLDDEIRSVLEDLFEERFPEETLQSVRDLHRTESSGLDELAYASALWNRLLVSETISSDDLEALAAARAEAIRAAFLANGEFSEDRVKVIDATRTDSTDDEWIVTELQVVTD